MRRLPPLGSIQAFVQVARLGSLKAAADALALSSPALTRRIQSLEQFVGAPLFSRHHNVVALNERGIAFLNEIGPHLDAIATAVERVSEDQRSTRIRIAVPSLFAAQRLVPALPSLRQQHPQLIVDVDTGANRLARLDSDVDAAIVITEAIPDRFYARPLEHGRIVAIGSRALLDQAVPVRSPADLRRLPILLHREMPGAFDEWCRAAGFQGVRPASITHYDAGQLILDAAAAGLGVAFMLESHLDSSTDTRLVRVFSQSAASPYAYWFACPPAALQRRGVRQFHDWVVSHFAAPEGAAVVNG